MRVWAVNRNYVINAFTTLVYLVIGVMSSALRCVSVGALREFEGRNFFSRVRGHSLFGKTLLDEVPPPDTIQASPISNKTIAVRLMGKTN